MSHAVYLKVLSQISKKKAKFDFQDAVIFIEAGPKKNQWTFSTQVFCGDPSIPSSVHQCVSSSGKLRWEGGHAELKLDAVNNTVQFVDILEGPLTYIPFRSFLSAFSDQAHEWREILDDISHASSFR